MSVCVSGTVVARVVLSQPNFLSLVRRSRTQYPHLCRELVTLFLTIKRQPIAKFLNAGLLLLSNASFF